MSELSPVDFVRPQLRALSAYTLDQPSFRHKLDQNEVPWDFPRRLKQLALRRLEARDWARYPDFHADSLRRRLAERYAWPLEGVLVGNGSNELLGVLLEALAGPSAEVLGALPSFGLYEMFVRRSGATTRFLAPRADLRLPIDELLEEIARNPRRPLLLCSPNNPTGDAATVEQIEALLERLEAPLLLDNAYGEFCRHDYLPLLRRHRHLVLLRTFSKAWSLGGVRLGYLLADPELVTELIKVKLPYNVGLASVAIGEVALEHARSAERAVRTLVGRRAQWSAALSVHGLEVFPSEANFLLVRVPEALGDVATLQRGLAERGVLVRKVAHYPGLAGCFRVAVGSGVDLRATLAALQLVLPAAAPQVTVSQETSR